MIHSRFAAGFRQVGEPGVEPPALTGVEVAAFIPFFPLLLRNRGLSPDRVGLVIATMSLSGLLASTLWGHAADMVLGRLTTLRVVAALAAGMALVLNVVGSHLAPILVATTALSACWAAIVPVGDALALHHLGAERRPAYGRIRLWMSIGFAIAAVSFGSLFERAGLGAMPSTFALALFILLVWSAVADLPSTRPPRERTAATPSGALVRSAPRLLVILCAVVLVTTGSARSSPSCRCASAASGGLLSWWGWPWHLRPRSRSPSWRSAIGSSRSSD